MSDEVGKVKVGIQADTKGFESQLEKTGNKVGKSTGGLISKGINTGMVAVGAAIAGITLGLTSAVKKSIEFEASSQQVARIFGESSKSIIDFANNQSSAFNMSINDATKFASVYGNLIAGITSDQAENAKLTQQTLKASAVVASSTGRTMVDVMDRIRSGLLGNTESIEDLGINVNVAMLESTEAFRKFANGKSWNQLSFQTQQQIRLMAILEQASSKFGTEVNQNTGSSLQRLSAIISNISLNIGQGLKPIIDAVVGAFINMASSIELASLHFKNFMNTLFGINEQQKSTKSSAVDASKAQNKLGSTLAKTGKKASGALASFDEINSLQEQMADGGVSGGGVGGVIPPETTQSIADASNKLEALTPLFEKIKGAIKELEPYWGFMSKSVGNASDEIMYFLKPLISFIADKFGAGIIQILKSVMFAIGLFFRGLEVILGGLRGLIEADWIAVWNNTKTFTQQTLAGIGQFFVNAFTWIGNTVTNMTNATVTFFKNTWEATKTLTQQILAGIGQFFVNSFTWISNTVTNITKSIGSFLSEAWGNISKTVATTLTGLGTTMGNIWLSIAATTKNVWSGIWGTIKGFLNMIIGGINSVLDAWNNLKFEMPKSSFEVLGKKYNIGGFSFKVPQIPKVPMLASGGIVSSPTLAMVGEGRSSEAVLPLNQDTFSQLGNAIASAMGGQQRGNQEVTISLDGTKLGRAIIPILNNEQRRIGNTSVISLA